MKNECETYPSTNKDDMIERFVPVGDGSLLDDAPGWNSGSGGNVDTRSNQQPIVQKFRTTVNADDENSVLVVGEAQGPTCWKCKGSGVGKTPKKRRRGDTSNSKTSKDSHARQKPEKNDFPTPTSDRISCSVCQGKGYLPPKLQEAKALQSRPGEITRRRKCSSDWESKGPLPFVLRQSNLKERKHGTGEESGFSYNDEQAIRLLKQAESTNTEILVTLPLDSQESGTNEKSPFLDTESLPEWIPRRGEQLCNLVGTWKILQRVASHRWTTDDLVTSYFAGRFLSSLTGLPTSKSKGIRYLDLGCGNGSVLQMTTWQLMQQPDLDLVTCQGIEARKEAVQLARRSIAFNVGNNRNISPENGKDHCQEYPFVDSEVHHGDFRSFFDQHKSFHHSFDLVTGTPPYFRVDFTVTDEKGLDATSTDGENNDHTKRMIVTKAVINQGGMPSCKQSAPARCEFRGGVEAYCQAASKAMHSQSVFCVCENWLNDNRVYQGAQQAGLVVVEVLPVKGRTGKPSPLFAVYAMRKTSYFRNSIPEAIVLDVLTVRDDRGNWTEEYKTLLDAMSIPVT